VIAVARSAFNTHIACSPSLADAVAGLALMREFAAGRTPVQHLATMPNANVMSSLVETGLLWWGLAWATVLVVVGLLFVALVRGERGRGMMAAQMARTVEAADRLAAEQARLAGRFDQANHSVHDRLDTLSLRLGDGLKQQTEKTGETLRGLYERLAVLDQAERTIGELTRRVSGLHDIMANKQARGAFGEVQLRDLVTTVLPPSACAFQVTLGNGTRADCLIRLPDPPGSIVIDAKFPLESYRRLNDAADEGARERAGRTFAADVRTHVRDIAGKYIVPGETSEGAMMFLPSEAVYAELHAHFPETVEEAFRLKVWIVSPTTLWATLNTVRAILRDVRLQEQATQIQAEIRALGSDVARLAEQSGRLLRHFAQAEEDVRQIGRTAERAAGRAARIDLSQLDEPPATAVEAATAEADV
jgi:DNA recombination protein RmuC